MATLGETTQLGTAENAGSSTDVYWSGPFQAASSGTTSTISFYQNMSGTSRNFTLGIFTDNGSQTAPASLLAQTPGKAYPGSAGWAFDSVSQAITANAYYWLALRVSNSFPSQFFQGSVTGLSRIVATGYTGGLPAFPTMGATYANYTGITTTTSTAISIYATYTPSSSGGLPPMLFGAQMMFAPVKRRAIWLPVSLLESSYSLRNKLLLPERYLAVQP